MKNEILDFYKQTSPYTELGLYKDFARSLTNDIKELCLLQRMQIIHPIAFKNNKIRTSKNCFWGDMTKISNKYLLREDDILPTAISMLAELLRKNDNYSLEREAKDKIFVTCRGQAILLAAILKSKGIPARVRSGFASYTNDDRIYLDHWITEYFDKESNKWIFVDADCCCNDDIDFDIYDIPRDKFLTAAEVWRIYRNNKIDSLKLGHAYYDIESKLLEIITTALFYDFHCLMNDEIIYLHHPKFLREKNFKLNEDDLIEIDNLADALLDPNKNFEKLCEIWDTNTKFRNMVGGTID